MPDAYDDYCPNYSTALLTTDDDTTLTGIATDYDAEGVCRAYYDTGPA